MGKEVSEDQKNNWIIKAKKKNALKLIILYCPIDDECFPHYRLSDNKESEDKERILLLSNTFIEEIIF